MSKYSIYEILPHLIHMHVCMAVAVHRQYTSCAVIQ